MADNGYIYRNPRVTKEDLQLLLGKPKWGWEWNHTTMHTIHNDTIPTLSPGEGHLCETTREIRWRCVGETYDVLVLALSEQQFDIKGFEQVFPYGKEEQGVWCTDSTEYLLKTSTGYETAKATQFQTPRGKVQFVALIAHSEKGS